MNIIRPVKETEDTVTLFRTDFEALLEAVEDAEDIASSREVMARIAAGKEEALPACMVERLITRENPVRVWREHRGLTAKALAAKAGVSAPYLCEIEAGKKPGSLDAMAKIARALNIALDDLAPAG